MKYPLKFIFILCLVGFTTKSTAQTAIIPYGGNSSGTGGTVSYTIGQIAYTSNGSASGSISQGVQQPYEITVMTGIENQSVSLTLSVYPNPVSNVLTLKINNYDAEEYSYKLFDVNGNLLESNEIVRDQTPISMSRMISGIYFLRVHDNKKELKTFKIIKN